MLTLLFIILFIVGIGVFFKEVIPAIPEMLRILIEFSVFPFTTAYRIRNEDPLRAFCLVLAGIMGYALLIFLIIT